MITRQAHRLPHGAGRPGVRDRVLVHGQGAAGPQQLAQVAQRGVRVGHVADQVRGEDAVERPVHAGGGQLLDRSVHERDRRRPRLGPGARPASRPRRRPPRSRRAGRRRAAPPWTRRSRSRRRAAAGRAPRPAAASAGRTAAGARGTRGSRRPAGRRRRRRRRSAAGTVSRRRPGDSALTVLPSFPSAAARLPGCGAARWVLSRRPGSLPLPRQQGRGDQREAEQEVLDRDVPRAAQPGHLPGGVHDDRRAQLGQPAVDRDLEAEHDQHRQPVRRAPEQAGAQEEQLPRADREHGERPRGRCSRARSPAPAAGRRAARAAPARSRR